VLWRAMPLTGSSLRCLSTAAVTRL
jgi:hypothetical protein